MVRGVIVAAAVLAAAQSAAHAATPPSHARMATLAFRLEVQTKPTPQMTFWVAYGPPAPHFGVVRLHRAANGDYVGSRALAAGASISFMYLAGWGSVRTRAGLMPGDPVAMIKRTGQIPIGSGRVPAAIWSGPTG